MINFDILNTAIFNSFAETVLINKTGGDLPLQAIFEKIVQNNALGGHIFTDATFTLTISAADIADLSIEQFDSVTVHGYQYQVLEITNDPVSDLAIIKIKRF